MSGYRPRMLRSRAAAACAVRVASVLALVLALGAAACRSAPLPPPRPFTAEIDGGADRFLVIGDSRRGFPIVEWGAQPSDAERIEYARALRDERPAFVAHVGDIARTGAQPAAWRDFDVDFAPLRDAGVALLPALGNHEYRGANGPALDLYFARFPALGRCHCYTRTFRGVRLVFLDSNVDEAQAPGADEQLAWLAAELDRTHDDDAVRAVMVFAHHPPYTNRVHPSESDWVRDHVVPLLSRYPKARALFAGHVHSYERFVVDGVHCVVTGGAGSPLHALRDPDDDDARPDLHRGPRTFHYCRVVVGTTLSVDVVMRAGDGAWFVADSFDI